VHKVRWLKASLIFPKVRHVLFFALAHSTLIIVADSLLSPERALSFKIHFVGAEEWSLFQLREYRGYLGVKVFQLLDWGTRSIKISFCYLGSTLRRVEVVWEVFYEEVRPFNR
jgi:hypothetical protein